VTVSVLGWVSAGSESESKRAEGADNAIHTAAATAANTTTTVPAIRVVTGAFTVEAGKAWARGVRVVSGGVVCVEFRVEGSGMDIGFCLKKAALASPSPPPPPSPSSHGGVDRNTMAAAMEVPWHCNTTGNATAETSSINTSVSMMADSLLADLWGGTSTDTDTTATGHGGGDSNGSSGGSSGGGGGGGGSVVVRYGEGCDGDSIDESSPCVRGYWGPALEDCEIVMCWNNSYSLLRDKTITYAYNVSECNTTACVSE
jgi:uncharacterized membrane protein YgcG